MATSGEVTANIDLTSGRDTRSVMMLKVTWEGFRDFQVEGVDQEISFHDVCWIRINRTTTMMVDIENAYKVYFNMRANLWWTWSDCVCDVSHKTAEELGYEDGKLITVSVVRANIDLAEERTTRSTMMLEVRWEGDKDVQVEDEDREGEDAVIYDVCWIRINRNTTKMNYVHEAYKMYFNMARGTCLWWPWSGGTWIGSVCLGSNETAEELGYEDGEVITVSVYHLWFIDGVPLIREGYDLE